MHAVVSGTMRQAQQYVSSTGGWCGSASEINKHSDLFPASSPMSTAPGLCTASLHSNDRFFARQLVSTAEAITRKMANIVLLAELV